MVFFLPKVPHIIKFEETRFSSVSAPGGWYGNQASRDARPFISSHFSIRSHSELQYKASSSGRISLAAAE